MVGFFDKMKGAAAASRLLEQAYYEKVATELREGIKIDSIYLKAITDSEGNSQRAEALYVKYRVQSLKDEEELASFNAKAQKEWAQSADARAIQSVIERLKENGYHAKKSGNGWRVREPLGGLAKLEDDRALFAYAADRAV